MTEPETGLGPTLLYEVLLSGLDGAERVDPCMEPLLDSLTQSDTRNRGVPPDPDQTRRTHP